VLRNKVPEVTAIFWITKVLTTAMGETTSDFMVHQIDPPVAVAIGFVVLTASLVLQFAVKRFLPWVYWFAVVMVSVFGTMVADVIHVQFGVPYAVSTVCFLVALAAIFALWYATQKTLSIHSIDTRAREMFYWAAVLATFALGTAAGDLTATTFHLGYLASGILFAVIIAIPAIGFRYWGWNGVFSFWFAYIITRPLGASFSDWLGLPPERGGVGIGTGPVSAVLTVAIIVCVAIMARDHTRASRVPALAVNAPAE
jgi:uncharacterized membrane-anchored protein